MKIYIVEDQDKEYVVRAESKQKAVSFALKMREKPAMPEARMATPDEILGIGQSGGVIHNQDDEPAIDDGQADAFADSGEGESVGLGE